MLLTLLVVSIVAFAAMGAPPDVSVEIAATQDDPTRASPIVFEATFSEPVTGFDATDVSISGTGGPGIVAVATDNDMLFAIEITLAEDGTEDGMIIVSIPAGVCSSVSTAEPNAASTSLHHDVLYDTLPPPEPAGTWPPDGAILSDTSPTFSWDPVEDVAGGSGLKNYRVTIVGLVERDTYKTTTSYTPQLVEGDSYAWRVYARDCAGNVSSYTWTDFVIDASAPVNATVSSTSHVIDTWSRDRDVSIAVAGDAWDAWTEVDGFEIDWTQSAAWTGSGAANRVPSWAGDIFTATTDGDWWFHLSTGDMAGNWSDPVHLGPFRIDATAPADPRLSSASHAIHVWSNASAVEIEAVGAGDAGAGVDGFEIEWNQSATWSPTETRKHEESWTGATYAATSDGDWYVHAATVDNADNWSGGTTLGPFRIDTEAPANPAVVSATHAVGVWSEERIVSFSEFETSYDAHSGVDGYAIEWIADATGTAAYTRWMDVVHGEVGIESEDGSWHLACQTVDRAGNASDIAHFGPYRIDTTAPEIFGVPQDLTVMVPHGQETGACSWEEPTATDLHSGLAGLHASHAPGDLFFVGTTTVTYAVTDRCGNSATASFDVTVAQSPQQLSIVASDEAGSFLDRCLDLNEGQEPPMAGRRPLQAVYAAGEPIVGSCHVLDSAGAPCASTYIIVSLYTVDVASVPEALELLDSWNGHYDRDEECYRFEVDTTALAPGVYDLRLGFEDGSTEWIRVEVVAPAV
ncbi:HYR domain-containing protein [Candidatus Bipolaricaulota bacterium]|nr:HYR domain-containing protein [Candidatus Bipolaricaulota bacterium]